MSQFLQVIAYVTKESRWLCMYYTYMVNVFLHRYIYSNLPMVFVGSHFHLSDLLNLKYASHWYVDTVPDIRLTGMNGLLTYIWRLTIYPVYTPALSKSVVILIYILYTHQIQLVGTNKVYLYMVWQTENTCWR